MDATLEATSRNRFGKNEAGRIRREGQIPAVVYGDAHAAEPVTVNPKDLLRILHSESGANTLISLKIDGKGPAQVLVKEYQLHPVEQNLLHADFYLVAMDKVLRVTVPVHLTGVAKGIKEQGGIVDFVHREVVMECLPADIPEHITVDVTELMLHDGVRVRDLDTGGKWKPVSEPEMMIVHVVTVKVEEAPVVEAAATAAVPGATAAEPEVIKKGKKDEDDEKADKKDKK